MVKWTSFYIVKAGTRYPVHFWRPKPEHGDYCTDAAFVLHKVLHAEPLGGDFTTEPA